MKVNSSLSFSLFVCKVLNSRVETRAPAAGQIFPPLFLSELDAQFPCNAIRLTTPSPLPWICTLFSRTYVSPRNSSSTPYSDTRLYSVCEYKIEVIRKEPPKATSCTDLTDTFVIKECRYPYRCIFRQRYVAFSSPVSRSCDTCIFLFPRIFFTMRNNSTRLINHWFANTDIQIFYKIVEWKIDQNLDPNLI